MSPLLLPLSYSPSPTPPLTHPLTHPVLDSAHARKQVSRTLEYAFDDYVVAQALRLYIDYHQYKNQWYHNRSRSNDDKDNDDKDDDDGTVPRQCTGGNTDHKECRIFPVVNDEGDRTLRANPNSNSNRPYLILPYPALSFLLLTAIMGQFDRDNLTGFRAQLLV